MAMELPLSPIINTGGALTDGDKGDVSVAASGATWTIDANVVTFGKMQQASAGSILLGRGAGGVGDLQEITLGANLSMAGTVLSATGGGGISDGVKGEITVASSGTVWTINAGVVTLTDMANVATATFIGRTTAGTGVPEAMTATQSRAVLNVANGATANSADAFLLARANHTGTQAVGTITGLAAIATSGSAADLASGILPAARFDDTAHGARAGGALHANVVAAGAAGFMTGTDKTKLDGIATGATAYVHPNHSGDVTSLGDGAQTIAAGAVTLAKQANVATGVIMGRVTAATGVQEALTPTQVRTLINVADGSTANSSDASLRDRSTHTGTQLAATISNFDAAVSANTAVAANTAKVTNATHTGDATGATALTLATVNANVGSFGLAASVAQFTVNAKGLITAAVNVAISIASTAISDSTAAGRAFLTAATATAQTALLDLATTSVKGLAPVRSGVATQYLDGTGVYSTPAGGGGGVTDGDKGDITASSGGTIWRVDPNIKIGLPIVLASGAFNL